MDFNSYITTRNAFFLTPVIFFWIVWSCALGFCIYFLPNDYRIHVLHIVSVAGFLFPYLISFSGSAILLYTFYEKQFYRICIFPFTLITAFGILFCLVDIFLTGTLYEWPVVPIAGILLKLSLLLATPAITLLLIPFVNERERPHGLSFTCLLILSFIVAIPVLSVFMEDIFPLFDPEFVWSKFWDFSLANMWVEALFELYIVFVMLVIGLLSIIIITDVLKSSPASEGDA